MTNVWLKNKAVVWALIVVFLFTSVFNTGISYAETTEAQTQATVESVTVWNYDAEQSVTADMSEMTEDNTLDIIVPSDYVGCYIGVEVAVAGGIMYHNEECDEVLESPYSFSNFDWTEDNTGTVSFVVCTEDGAMDSYEITLHATGEPISDPDDDSDGDEGGEVINPDEGEDDATDPDEGESDGNYGWNSYFDYINVYSYEGLGSIGVDFSQMTDDGQLEVQIPTDYAGSEMTLDVSAGEGFVMWSEDGEDEFGNYNEFSLNDLTAGGSKTITFKIGEEGTDAFKTCSITISATINPYVEGIKVNYIGFADDFDGEVELSENNMSEDVSLALEVTEDGCYSEYLQLQFAHEDRGGSHNVTLWRNEDGQFENSFTVDRDHFNWEGTYRLKQIRNDNYEKVENLSELPLILEVKYNFSDNEAPSVNDIYLTVDGVKCEEQGFKITEEQSVVAWIDITDESGVDFGEISCWRKYEDGAGGANNELNFDEESGLYYADVTMNWEESAEWYLGELYVSDVYGNSTTYHEVNGLPLNQMYFYHGADAQPKEYTYTVSINIPGNWEDNDYEATTTRLTSFEELGIDFEFPNKTANVEFIGWRHGNADSSEIIKSADQIFSIQSDYEIFYPVFSKDTIRVSAYYDAADEEWAHENVFVGIDEGTTYGEFIQMARENNYLEAIEHAPDKELSYWSYDYYEDEDTVITGIHAYVEAYAQYKSLVTRTLYANGGVFADGSTEKTVQIDVNDEYHMSKLERPTREGYAFGGWQDGDGCRVDYVEWGCDDELHVIWIDEADASIRYGEIQFTRGESFEDEYEYRDIWCDDGETESRVTLPFDVNPDGVRLKVKKLDGTTVYEPIELDADGVTEYVYESVAADGVTIKTYTVTITLEEPPTSLYYTELKYFDRDGDYCYHEFEFDGTEATVTLPYSFNSERPITLCGRDVDGNWIESEGVVMGDADEVTITYTSEITGDVYKLTVVRGEPSNSTDFEFCLRIYNSEGADSYWYASEDFDENNEKTITLPYGAITSDSEVYFSVYPYDGATPDIPYDDEYGERRKLLEPDENGNYSTTVTMTAESGREKTYTINFVGNVDGSSTAISRLQYCWQWVDHETDEYRCVKMDIDEDAAKSEAGYDIFVPIDMNEGDKYYDIWIAADSDNGAEFTWISDGEECTRTGGISEYFGLYENDWEFTVTSPDGSTTETYRFHIKPVAIPDCEEHSFTNWIEYEDGMGEYCYCDVCGIHTSRPITGGEHEHIATGDWQYTDIEHWQLCECGQMLNANDHDYDEHVTKEATCTEPGQILYDCQCGYSYTEEIPVTDHQYTIETVEPTCTERGYIVFKCECGDSYINEYIDELGHDPAMMPVKEATCREEGSEGGFVCLNCDKVLEEPTILPMIPCDHSGPWEVVQEPNCIYEGIQINTCHMCGTAIEEIIPATGIHTEDVILGYDATCTEYGLTDQVYCNVCNEVFTWAEQIEPKGHEWGEWTLVGESETPGMLDYVRECNNCWETQSKTEVDPDYEEHDHDFNWSYDSFEHWASCECGVEVDREVHKYIAEIVPPTCTEGGYTAYTCECGYSYATNYTDAAGHDWSDWYQVESDDPEWLVFEKVCGTCNETNRTTKLNPDYENHVHQYEADVVEPKCEEGGFTFYTCECGDRYVADYTDPTGHHYADEWSFDYKEHYHECVCGDRIDVTEHIIIREVVDATCTTAGYDLYRCDCGYRNTDNFWGPMHKTTFVADKAPTCEEDGAYQHYYCSGCDGYFLDEYGVERITREKAIIPALGHEYVPVVTEPTCTEQGYTTYTCECGDSYIADYTEKTGHNWHEWTLVEKNDGFLIFERSCFKCYKTERKTEEDPNYEGVQDFDALTVTEFTMDGEFVNGNELTLDPETGYAVVDFTAIVEYGDTWTAEPLSYIDVWFDCPGLGSLIVCMLYNYETELYEAECNLDESYQKGLYTFIGFKTGDGRELNAAVSGEYNFVLTHEHDFSGDVIYDETGHWVECECGEPSKVTEHVYYEAVNSAPSCTESGRSTFYCEDCDYCYTAETEPIDHDLEYCDAVEATCEESGQIEHYYCYRCDGYFLDEEGFEATTSEDVRIERRDHVLEDELRYDDVEHWQVCTYCKDWFNAEEHEYSEEITEPTCTSEGYTTYSCECGHSYEADYVDPTAHDFSDGWVHDDNNHWLVCGECEACFNTEEHDWSDWEISSSYDEYIEYERYCRVCDALDSKTEEDPDYGDEHECTPAGDWVYDNDYHWHVCDCLEVLDMEEHQMTLTEEIEATCIDEGEKIFDCETCEYSYTEYSPTVDHEWSEWVLVDSFEGNFDYERYCDNCSEIEFKTVRVNHPEVVSLYYFTGDEEKYKKVDLDDDFVSTVEIPYSYNKEKGVVLEWRDTDGSRKENPVTWNADGTGVVEIESCNGYSYTINVTVAEAASNTDCSMSVGNSKGNSFSVDFDNAGSDEGAIVVVPKGNINDLFLRVITRENGYVEGMEYVVEDYVSYYKMNLTPDANGEINIVFTVIAENGEDIQEYRIKVMEEQPEEPEHKHNYVSVVTTPPTCFDKGYTTYTCVCGDSYVADYTNATNHANTTPIKGKAATCTATGLTDTERCLDCGLILEPQQVIKALGHDWDRDWTIDDDATCTAAGKQHKDCSRCDEKQTGTIPATGHNYDEDVTDPTCTEGGYTTYTCGECGHSYTGAQTAAAGHEWDEWYEDDSDCLGTSYFRMCDSCGTEDTKFEAGEGHDYETYTKVITKASSKAAGKLGVYQYCNTCQDEEEAARISTEVIPKAAAVKMSAVALTYTGKSAIPTLTVNDVNGKKLVKGTDYKVTIKNSAGKVVTAPKAVDKYKITITYMGNYKGSAFKNYTVNPAGTTLGKLTGGKNQITVKWTKKTAQVTGYQIRYSTKQNMNGAKTVLVTKAKTTSRVIKKLTAKKKYYVQIRTYKTVNGKKYFSAWSAKKNVKTK